MGEYAPTLLLNTLNVQIGKAELQLVTRVLALLALIVAALTANQNLLQ